MRILWLSNSPLAPSGYGGQSALFGPRIRDLGHEVAYAANFHMHSVNYEGIPIHDAGGGGPREAGNGKLGMWARIHKADWVICLYDAWVMNPEAWPDVNMALWAPVDHHPIPAIVGGVLHHERVRPIAMSRFGENWMRKVDLDPLYIPHGVDTSVYKQDDKARCLTALTQGKIPEDAFLVGMVAANRGWSLHASRKSFPEAFAAFARFSKRHPDAYLYVHSESEGNGNAQQLKVLAELLGISDRVLIPPMEAWWQNIFDGPFMVGMYSAFDVLLNPSMSEGFGIPIIEAQACGVPVIVTNHSAMPELCGSGWLVDGQEWWHDQMSAWAFMPFIHSIEEQLENAYKMRGDEKMRQQARRFAETYDADRITEVYWKPALEVLQEEIVSRQVRRSRKRKDQSRKAQIRARARR